MAFVPDPSDITDISTSLRINWFLCNRISCLVISSLDHTQGERELTAEVDDRPVHCHSANPEHADMLHMPNPGEDCNT